MPTNPTETVHSGPHSLATLPDSIDAIRVRGARVHNLKNISFEIPHNAHHRGHRSFRIGQIQPGV